MRRSLLFVALLITVLGAATVVHAEFGTIQPTSTVQSTTTASPAR